MKERGSGRGSESRDQRDRAIRADCRKAIQAIREHTDLRTRELPIEKHEAAMMGALEKYHAILVQAETGAGKSLDLAAMVLRSPELQKIGRIAMTQPRRDAAQAVAVGIAARHDLNFGDDVCFTTSEFRGNTQDTKIAVQTTGVLMNAFRKDPLLTSYDCVIIDEAHERDIDIDICLALLKKANQQRRLANKEPLYTVIASATIDTQKFANYIEVPDDGVFSVKGRMYPIADNFIENRRPSKRDEYDPRSHDPYREEESEVNYIQAAAEQVVNILQSTETGDILVFMPGLRSINSAMGQISSRAPRGVEVLRLHGSDRMEDRSSVLAGSETGRRRVIVSTNIAETSLTVPNIMYVVDSCRKNEMTYNSETGVHVLEDVLATRAECMQRRGRAGRINYGEYYPMLSEEQFDQLEKFPTPEIRRAEMSSVVLRLLHLGFTDIENFDFIDKPKPEAIAEALYLLEGLGLINNRTSRQLTERGEAASRLPLEPRLATMVIAAQEKGCVDEVVHIAAMTSEINSIIYIRPSREFVQDVFYILQNQLPQRIEGVLRDQAVFQNRSTPEEKRQWQRHEDLLSVLRTVSSEQSPQQSNFDSLDQTIAPVGPTLRDAERVSAAIIEYRQAALIQPESQHSDWMSLLDIVYAYKNADHRDEFAIYNGLDPNALEKVLENSKRIMKELGRFNVDISSSYKGADLLERITECVLTGYAPDHVIRQTGGRHDIEYERIDRKDNNVRIARGSRAGAKLPQLAVTLSMQEGPGQKRIGRRNEIVRFRYAAGIHPVTAAALRRAVPNRIHAKSRPGGLSENGQLLQYTSYSFVARDGSLVPLDIEAAPATTAVIVADIMKTDTWNSAFRIPNDEELFCVEANKKIVQELDLLLSLWHFGHALPTTALDFPNSSMPRNVELEEWYVAQVTGKATVAELTDVPPDFYRIPMDRYIDHTIKQKINEYFPTALKKTAFSPRIEYDFSFPEGWTELQPQATIHFGLPYEPSREEKVQFCQLTEQDIRAQLASQTLVPIDNWTLRFVVKGEQFYYYHSMDDTGDSSGPRTLEELQAIYYNADVQKQWRQEASSSVVPPQLPPDFVRSWSEESLIQLIQRNNSPQVYGIDLRNEQLIKYPSIHLMADGYVRLYVRYYPTAAEAANENTKTIEAFRQMVSEFTGVDMPVSPIVIPPPSVPQPVVPMQQPEPVARAVEPKAVPTPPTVNPFAALLGRDSPRPTTTDKTPSQPTPPPPQEEINTALQLEVDRLLPFAEQVVKGNRFDRRALDWARENRDRNPQVAIDSLTKLIAEARDSALVVASRRGESMAEVHARFDEFLKKPAVRPTTADKKPSQSPKPTLPPLTIPATPVNDRSLEALATRFSRGSRDSGPEDPMQPTPDAAAVRVVPTEAAPTEPATEQERAQLTEQLKYVEGLVGIMRSFGKPRTLGEKDRPDAAWKAHKKIHDLFEANKEILAEARLLLREPKARAVTIQGKITDLQVKFTKGLSNTLPDLEKGWDLERFSTARQFITNQLENSSDLKEYIQADMITEVDARVKCWELFTKSSVDIVAGRTDGAAIFQEFINGI